MEAATNSDYTVKEAMGTWQFWLLWAMLFLNVDTSIYVVAVVLACSLVLPLIAKRPRTKDAAQRSPVQAAA